MARGDRQTGTAPAAGVSENGAPTTEVRAAGVPERPLSGTLANDPSGPDGEQDLLTTLSLLNEGQPNGQAAPELEGLLRENSELRAIIAELKQASDPGPRPEAEDLLDRQKEYESLLEEKSEVIRSLHLRIQELEAHRPAAPATPKEEELLALSEELDRERCQMQQERRQLEEDRRQLRDDEQLMTKQMRDMEVQMARERADFARQRSELNRIYEDIRREMDNIERNGMLNQRLSLLRQRTQETVNPGGGPPTPRAPGAAAPDPSNPGTAAEPPAGSTKRRDTLLGRIFG
jgi:hypothetical protein